MTESLVRYQAEEGVATLVLARPAKLNAFTRAMLQDLRAGIERAGADPSLRVLVLTGEGRAFGTGQDLADVAPAEIEALLAEAYAPLVRTLIGLPLVSIAALNGMAVGAAASLTLACDITLAAESASLAQAFVKIGLIPDAGGTWLLPRAAGYRTAMALALTGDTISAREAQAMGLVYRVFADDGFSSEVAAFARRIAANSPTACRLIKQSLRASLGNGLSEQMALEAKLQGEAAQSPEFEAALAAFRARRRA